MPGRSPAANRGLSPLFRDAGSGLALRGGGGREHGRALTSPEAGGDTDTLAKQRAEVLTGGTSHFDGDPLQVEVRLQQQCLCQPNLRGMLLGLEAGVCRLKLALKLARGDAEGTGDAIDGGGS